MEILVTCEKDFCPCYQSEGAAGADLCACITEPVILEPGERALVPTGVRISVPAGFEAQVRPRSGLAIRNGITTLNSPGTIDSDYRGEIKVILINHGAERVRINRGDRIAQLVVAPVVRAGFRIAETLDATARSENGFGSTGVSGAAL